MMLESLTTFKSKFSSATSPFTVWAGIRGLDAEQFSSCLPVEMVICPDNGKELHDYCKERILCSYEQETGIRPPSYQAMDFLFDGEFGKFIKQKLTTLNRPVSLIPFQSHPLLEKMVHTQKHIRLLSTPIKNKRRLDNKLTLPTVLSFLKLPTLPGEIAPMKALKYDRLAQKYGLPLVMQLPVGGAGKGTCFIDKKNDFNFWKETFQDNTIKVTQYMEGTSCSINAVVMPDQIVCSQPNVQIVGQPELVTSPTSYCGTDFCAMQYMDIKWIETMYDYTTRIGQWMHSQGFLGMFGLDWVITSDAQFFITEINARFTGENQFLADFQKMIDMVPLSFFHVAAFEKFHFSSRDWSSYKEQLFTPLTGSCLTLHHTLEKPLRIINELLPGFYRFEDNRLVFLREGWTLSQAKDRDEICITSGVPKSGAILQPGAIILRIQFFETVLENDLKSLTTKAKKIIHWIKQYLTRIKDPE